VSTTNAIEVRGLTLAYGKKRVLDNIDLSIPKGSVVGLVGPNGAGKSSLIHCLLGAVVPLEGHVSVLEEDPKAFSDAARSRIGYVAQTPDLLEWMKARQYLDYISAFYPHWDHGRVGALMEKWGIDPKQKISDMSLGQKQKIALLQSLGNSPTLLILDEPVASLDPIMRRDFMRSLFEDDAQRTVVISSHLLSDLERIITHLVLVKDGSILVSEEWDVAVESLQKVRLPETLAPQAGLIAQRSHNGQVTVVVDVRTFDRSAIPQSATLTTMNLDEIFVEVMS
jgi:ABC-2 type transport system ATP-binding protein